ncbi:MAG: RNA polymerase sporulation sigma factor SigK [Oscillospiraceae bacterium]|nr:RNA polymerase sporulation sigma factor SigK [Oscillospiraceae bacterium]
MFSVSLYLLLHSLYVTLRISGGGSFPKPLSAEEEKKYLTLAENGDETARDILVERNLRLVAHVMKKYYTASKDHEDLISIGTIGLIKAVNTFDSSKKIKLATYAGRCIENEILMYFRTQRKVAGEIMMFDTIESDGDGNSLVLGDTLSDESEEILDRLDREEMYHALMRGMDELLDDREKDIITKRYGMDNKKPMTQREIALRCGISRSYVSRIEKKALEKLKKWFDNPSNKRVSY